MAKYIIIAGTSTIGQALAKQLLAQGHQVLITGRTADRTQSIAASLGSDYRLLNAADFEQTTALLTQVKNDWGGLDGVVNCAGSLLLKPAHRTTAADFNEVIEANLLTAFACVQAAGQVMLEGGSVVLIASAIAQLGMAQHEAIAAAKAGIIGLMRSAAATYAARKLRVNAVAPGMTATALTAKLVDDPIYQKIIAQTYPLGRIAMPEEVARVIAFLLLPENSYITGQVITIDGGLSTLQPKVKI